jgi:hypothetical protein
VDTIDRIHELRLQVPGVVTDSQSATVLAVRELLFIANFNDVAHFFAVGNCIYKMRANKILSSDHFEQGRRFFLFAGDLSSLQECRKEQMLKTFDRDRGTLHLGLKDRALQRCNQQAGELIAVVLA